MYVILHTHSFVSTLVVYVTIVFVVYVVVNLYTAHKNVPSVEVIHLENKIFPDTTTLFLVEFVLV